jgi:hypothetical protein
MPNNNNDTKPCTAPGCRGTMRYYEQVLPERYGRNQPTATHHDGELVLQPARQPGWVCDQDPRHAEPD